MINLVIKLVVGLFLFFVLILLGERIVVCFISCIVNDICYDLFKYL